MLEASDQELVRLLRARDQRGFDWAYQRYSERIFGFLVRLARSRPLAEDLFQYTFMRLAERGVALRADSNLRAWLFSVARNAFHSHARAESVAARVEQTLGPLEVRAGADSGVLVDELETALAGLNCEDREILLLLGVEGLAVAEVAAIFEIEPVALRKRLSRARGRLADALDAEPEVVRKSKADR